MSLTNQQLADKLSDVADGWKLFVNMVRAFVTTDVTGGPNNDGYVEITDEVISELIPGLKLLQSQMQKGDSAATDLAFSFPGGAIGGGELLQIYAHGGDDMTFDFTRSVGVCDAGLAAPAIVSLTKNGVAWGTVTFSTAGAVAFSFSSNTLTHGQVVRVYGPATYIPTFVNPAFTLAGNVS